MNYFIKNNSKFELRIFLVKSYKKIIIIKFELHNSQKEFSTPGCNEHTGEVTFSENKYSVYENSDLFKTPSKKIIPRGYRMWNSQTSVFINQVDEKKKYVTTLSKE